MSDSIKADNGTAILQDSIYYFGEIAQQGCPAWSCSLLEQGHLEHPGERPY
jgi:hypothetical protein